MGTVRSVWDDGEVSEEKTAERPRQVTLSGYVVIVGSVILVLAVFETLSGLGSLDTREAVDEFLAEPPGDGLGLSTQGALSALRILGMVTAACAAAAGILGYHVLQRNKAARLGLTVVAVPLLVAGMATAGGFVSSMVAAAAFLLWLQPARDWFAGRTPVTAADQRGMDGSLAPWSRPTTAPHDPSSAAGAPGPTAPAPAATPFGTPYGAQRPVARPTKPPAPLVGACALTWLFAGVTAVVATIGLVVFALDSGPLVDEMQASNPQLAEAGFDQRTMVTMVWVSAVSMIVWALGAVALAFLTYRGLSWARILLMVSAAGALGLLLFGVLGQPVLLVPVAAAVATISLLNRPESRAWATRNSVRDPR